MRRQLKKPAAALRIFIFCLVTSCCLLSSAAMAEFQRTRIAVLDFEQVGEPLQQGLGSIVAEWFTTGLVKSGRFEVIDRAMLQKAMAEQKLNAAGIDESSAAALGRILGVKVVATGSVIRNGHNLEVNTRMIGVESGDIIAAASRRTNTAKELHSLVDELTAGVIRDLPLTGYVVKKTPGAVIIDVGLDSGLAPGTEFLVYREGEVIRHPKTGEILDVEQIETGRLRITRISKNVAEGEILEEKRGGIQDGQLVKSTPMHSKRQGRNTSRKSKQ